MLEELGADVTGAALGRARPARPRGAAEPRSRAPTSSSTSPRSVGGIGYNRRNPAPLAYDNLAMGMNVFEACRDLAACEAGRRLLGLRLPEVHARSRSRRTTIWDGYPEESNAPYGLAKKMLLVLSDAYRRQYGFDSCAPVIANLYGPDDNFDLEDSHVIAAMIRKFVEAVERGEPEVVAVGHRRALARVPLRRRRRARAAPRRRALRHAPTRSTSAPASRRGSATSPRRSRG